MRDRTALGWGEWKAVDGRACAQPLRDEGAEGGAVTPGAAAGAGAEDSPAVPDPESREQVCLVRESTGN